MSAPLTPCHLIRFQKKKKSTRDPDKNFYPKRETLKNLMVFYGQNTFKSVGTPFLLKSVIYLFKSIKYGIGFDFK